MSTSEDHDGLSDSDFIDYPAIAEHYEVDGHHSRRANRLLPIPDLRFEQSYLKSINAFVHVEQSSAPNVKVDAELEGPLIGREVTPIVDSSHQLVKIDWRQVIWATTRDQIISPLLQGALWGLASDFIRPLFSLVGSHLRGTSPRSSHRAMSEPGWWKWWTHGLGLRSSSAGNSNGVGRE